MGNIFTSFLENSMKTVITHECLNDYDGSIEDLHQVLHDLETSDLENWEIIDSEPLAGRELNFHDADE